MSNGISPASKYALTWNLMSTTYFSAWIGLCPRSLNFCHSLQYQLHMAKNPVHTRQRHIGSSVARTHQVHSKIIGFLLYYAWAVNNKLLVALIAISTQQGKVTVHMEQLVKMLLNYVTTYSNDGIVYRASDMVCWAHADAGYLIKTWSCSRAGAHTFLSEDDPSPLFNGTVCTVATFIKYVMALAAEAELAALFIAADKIWFPTGKPS